MSAHAIGRMTADEYLAAERASELRSEFFNGEVFAMSGGTDDHGHIANRAAYLLTGQLDERPCRIYGGSVMVQAGNREGFCIPDVMVIWEKPSYADDRKDIITNPVLVIEVLSPSTEKWDRGGKFDYYRRIPSLREYVLIFQDQMRVEWFSRSDSGDWVYRTAVGPEGIVDLASLSVQLPLAKLYKNVDLA